MNLYLALLPFAAIILLIFGWSIPKLVRAFRQSLWKEETVKVTKALRDELPYFSYRLGGKDLTSDRIPDDIFDGEPVTFIFPKGLPERARMKAMREDWTFNLILFVFGCLATSMITWMAVEGAASNREDESWRALRTTGMKITVPASNATFVKPDEDQDEYTLHVVCIDPRDSSELRLEGSTYVYDPTEQLSALDTFYVYVDSTNRDRYLLGISFTAPITSVSDRPPVEDKTIQRTLICFLIGLVLFGGCFYWLFHQYHLVARGDRAVAKVLNFVSKRTSKGYAYYPFVQFSTATGMRIRTTLPEGSNPPAYEVGDNVVIFYRHEVPADVTTLNLSFIIFPSVLMFAGAALMMAGVYFFMN